MMRLAGVVCAFLFVGCASSQVKTPQGVVKETNRKLTYSASAEVPSAKERRDIFKWLPNELWVNIKTTKKNPDSAYLTLTNSTTHAFPKDCNDVNLFSDGAVVELTSIKYYPAVYDSTSGEIPEYMAAVLPKQSVALLQNASYVEGDICGLRFLLNDAQTANLREYARSVAALTAPSVEPVAPPAGDCKENVPALR